MKASLRLADELDSGAQRVHMAAAKTTKKSLSLIARVCLFC